MIPPYPLQWPETLPRAKARSSSQFRTTLTGALNNVESSLRALGRDSGVPVRDVVISSNVTLGQNKPADPGVAAWFTWDGEQRCIAVDRYGSPAENLQAIFHVLEARRTELRHGGLHIVRQSFRGFGALPPPASKPANWWEILGVSRHASSDEIDAAWRLKMRTAHPDHGGSHDLATRLNAARDEGKRSNG